MFFRKAKRIAELEAKNNRQSDTCMDLIKVNGDLRNQIEYLVRTIRGMDDQIFQMTQMSSFEAMRPHFVQLQDGMTSRKVAESNRIADILRPELEKTYAPQTKTIR